MSEMSAELNASLGQKVASMDARLTGLEGSMKSITGALDNLASKIERRSETPWGSIWAACGVVLTVLTTVGWMALSPVKETTSDQAARINEMSRTFMAKDDIKDLFRSAAEATKAAGQNSADDLKAFSAALDRRADLSNARRDDYQRMADKRSQENTDRIAKVEERMVAFREHEEHWKADAASFADHQRQIDELRRHLRDDEHDLWRREGKEGPR